MSGLLGLAVFLLVLGVGGSIWNLIGRAKPIKQHLDVFLTLCRWAEKKLENYLKDDYMIFLDIEDKSYIIIYRKDGTNERKRNDNQRSGSRVGQWV